jgi:hypothetical protein
VTLTLNAGAHLSFATSDLMRAYDDPSECELRVQGILAALGAADALVTFDSQGGVGTWDGVALLAGSEASTPQNRGKELQKWRDERSQRGAS